MLILYICIDRPPSLNLKMNRLCVQLASLLFKQVRSSSAFSTFLHAVIHFASPYFGLKRVTGGPIEDLFHSVNQFRYFGQEIIPRYEEIKIIRT